MKTYLNLNLLKKDMNPISQQIKRIKPRENEKSEFDVYFSDVEKGRRNSHRSSKKFKKAN